MRQGRWERQALVPSSIPARAGAAGRRLAAGALALALAWGGCGAAPPPLRARAPMQNLKVVALVSGGKDSTMNMMRCVEHGHEIVCLGNLFPAPSESDELDSFMYQTVGHDGIEAIAACMELPLYRRPIRPKTSINQALEYTTTQGDEVEDLFALLQFVKMQHPEVAAVATGAILSNYQRTRVEAVCMRLGLVSLAFLWQSDQAELLDEMIHAGARMPPRFALPSQPAQRSPPPPHAALEQPAAVFVCCQRQPSRPSAGAVVCCCRLALSDCCLACAQSRVGVRGRD